MALIQLAATIDDELFDQGSLRVMRAAQGHCDKLSSPANSSSGFELSFVLVEEDATAEVTAEATTNLFHVGYMSRY